jgi:hypothetical protein
MGTWFAPRADSTEAVRAEPFDAIELSVAGLFGAADA